MITLYALHWIYHTVLSVAAQKRTFHPWNHFCFFYDVFSLQYCLHAARTCVEMNSYLCHTVHATFSYCTAGGPRHARVARRRTSSTRRGVFFRVSTSKMKQGGPWPTEKKVAAAIELTFLNLRMGDFFYALRRVRLLPALGSIFSARTRAMQR